MVRLEERRVGSSRWMRRLLLEGRRRLVKESGAATVSTRSILQED